jgi:hypothetical protein
MKKFWILLVVLAVFAVTSPLYAGDNVTVGGEFQYFVSSAPTQSFPQAELNINSMVGDYNEVALELDFEGAALPADVQVDDFRLKTDILGSLGLMLPVTLNTTVGYFDTYFTSWAYTTRSGYAFYIPWPNAVLTNGPNAVGAIQVDLGVGPATVHYWNDFNLDNIMAAVDVAVGPINANVNFGAPTADFGGGQFGVEVKYSMMGNLNLAVPAFFSYNLGASAFTWGIGAGVGISMLTFNFGIEGDTANALDNIVIEAIVAPVAGLQAGVSAYMDLAAADVFAGIDIFASYMFGSAKFMLGYAYASPSAGTIPVDAGDNIWLSGLYFGTVIWY